MRGLFAGGAPAPPALFRFFESLGIPLVELYGMSETAGMISSNLLAGPRRESCAGLITVDHEVRFAADGELDVRGPLLLCGFLEPEDGAEVWIGTASSAPAISDGSTSKGFLHIVGRRKSLIVLSTGKKLSPEPIELAIASTAPFHGAVLFGEGQPFVAAAVFVERAELARLAAAGVDVAVALLPRARAALAAVSDFEKPKKLLVLPGTPQDDPALLTPTLKVKRAALLAAHGPAVAELFLALVTVARRPPGRLAAAGRTGRSPRLDAGRRPLHGWYMSAAMLFLRFAGRRFRASFIAYAFSATADRDGERDLADLASGADRAGLIELVLARPARRACAPPPGRARRAGCAPGRPRRPGRCPGRRRRCCPGRDAAPCRGRSPAPNGLPLVKTARPRLHAYACSAVHSACEVGFDRAKITGRSLSALICSTTARVNVPGAPVAPIRTCGRSASIASHEIERRVVVGVGKVVLQEVRPGPDDQAVHVDEPEVAAGLVEGEALVHEGGDHRGRRSPSPPSRRRGT